MIVKSPKICGGQPRIEGTRLTVSCVLSLVYSGKNPKQVAKTVNKYHGTSITEDQVKEAIEYSVKEVSK